jgi:hypothetical protein
LRTSASRTVEISVASWEKQEDREIERSCLDSKSTGSPTPDKLRYRTSGLDQISLVQLRRYPGIARSGRKAALARFASRKFNNVLNNSTPRYALLGGHPVWNQHREHWRGICT